MKTATLHTGEVMHFPDETPDDFIHGQVRTRMGLPPPIDPTVEAHQNTQIALAGNAQSSQQLTMTTAALHQQIGALLDALQQFAQMLTQSIAATNQAMAQSVAQMSHIADQLAGVADQMRQSTEHHVAGVNEVGNRHLAVAQATHQAIGVLGQQVDSSADKIVNAVRAPKKVVKSKDGSFTSA